MQVRESMTKNADAANAEDGEARRSRRRDFGFLSDLCVSANSALKELRRVANADFTVTEAA